MSSSLRVLALCLAAFTFLTHESIFVAADCTTYIVQSGDTCYDIAQANGISLSDFESWNEGINCDNLQIGQSVCISQPTSSPPTANYNGKVFSEYIGALYNGVQFTDVPIRSDVNFYFILAFAIDYTYDDATPTNGIFDIYWQNSVLTPDAVQAIKSQYSNVKVLVSLGGDTINSQFVQFSATSVDSWVANAVSSLTSLINEYHLDGIDIDYEHFDNVETETFVSCIGGLITQLKDNGVISVATIAPFDGVETQYSALWGQYGNVIDLVNFQFYSYSASTTASQYVSLYNTAAGKYGGGAKVLASFSTGGVGPAPSTVLSACEQLKANGQLPGIFIFSADSSYVSSVKFQYEEDAQALVAAS